MSLAMLLFIVKFLHELQHKATNLFFGLRYAHSTPKSITANSDSPIRTMESTPVCSAQQECHEARITLGEAAGVVSPTAASSPVQGQPRQVFHTPERVGSMMVDGVPRGDSGYRLEENLLGGRLRHRTYHKQGDFEVHEHYVSFSILLLHTLSCSSVEAPHDLLFHRLIRPFW